MKWHKFFKKYLTAAQSTVFEPVPPIPELAALPLLRIMFNAPGRCVVFFSGNAQADTVMSALNDLLPTLPEKNYTLLNLPETERGKLCFPGAESRRAKALDQALSGNYDLLSGSINAFTGAAPPPEESSGSRMTLRPGMTISPEELISKLVTLDYDDEYETTVPGEFSRRGGIVDLYSPAHDHPCRIEYFGDEIESLRSFAPETQRSTGKVESYEIIGRAGITAGGEADSDAIAYFEELDITLINVDPDEIKKCLTRYGSEKENRRYDDLCVRCHSGSCRKDLLFLHPDDIAPELPEPDLAAVFESDSPRLRRSKEEPAFFRLNELRHKITQLHKDGGITLIAAPDEERLADIKKWCKGRIDLKEVEFDTVKFRSGFVMTQAKLMVLTEKELLESGFVRELPGGGKAPAKTAPPPPSPQPEFSLAEIDDGDFAVHIDHGIGIFRGFKKLESNGVTREVIVMEYRDEQQIYVPLTEAYKLSRYVGAVSHVKLHAPNSSRWKNERLKAGAGVRSYAADMLRLQAMRQSISGIAMLPNDNAEQMFIDDFAFQDTPDQKRGSYEIGSDLGSPKPMDRLLCGDVGYGKTELAMRAAFRAVSCGYQVAVIAPTTVLAQQHYNTFCSRFAKYPYTVDVLSRFRSNAEQERTISRLATGGVDIVIGTHRLCSSKIQFRNLGLVVIDEEQRFGVQIKERLRRYRAEADVLSMSATPIPRTLYLAMAGARDLTTLMTPPKLRLPVKTVISPEDPALIAEAIRAELARGGQIYYLHNRVKTIDSTMRKLRALIPDCRFAAAHGQMPEHELENVMQEFLENRIDCLVCSTIIESGLDVPNANTIIIERADRFGLGELHQLRGRVGRWKHQAYAYMLLPRNTMISSDARKRIAAIRRCSSLGTGFQLAMHDLEIRGAGNLLGSEQSGHLNSIGFDLYCQLLKQEVAAMSGKKLDLLPEVVMTIDFVSYALNSTDPGVLCCCFPPEYIPSERLRFDTYRRLGNLQSLAELEDFCEEIRDRYGKLPEQTGNLMLITRIRLLAALADYRQLTVVGGRVSLSNPGGTIYRLHNGKAPQLDYRDAPRLRLHHLIRILSAIS